MTNRIENDAYFTTMASQILPPALQPLHDIFDLNHSTILEPCAGDRDIVKAIRSMGVNPYFIDSDLNDKLTPTWNERDATSEAFWSQPKLQHEPDFVISNLPFKDAHLIIPKAFEKAKIGVCFLLPISYLEPTKNRAKWLHETRGNLRNQAVLCPRPRFRTGINPLTGKPYSNYSMTFAWYTWLKEGYFGQSLAFLYKYPFYTPVTDWK